jgi:AmiR/NasT family two-component response regulator
MDAKINEPLDILVAGGVPEQLREVTDTLIRLGHHAFLEEGLSQVGPVTSAKKPDVAIVVVGESSEHALAMIGKIVHEAACPVIALLDVEDSHFVKEAAKRGIFAYITSTEDPEELGSSFDIVLRRFAEYHDLEGAFARRAVTERAEGILMERHSLDEREAFNMIRSEARRTNRKVTEVAEAILMSHRLLSTEHQQGVAGPELPERG